MQDTVTCVVPARLASGRFPGKMLHPLLGRPLLLHALLRAREAACFDRVVCLSDSPEILEVAAAEGFETVLTGPARNGTERIALALPRLLENPSSGLFVNLQGDEPAFPAAPLRLLVQALRAEPRLVHTLVHAGEPSFEDLGRPERVKAVLDSEGRVLDFRRRLETPPAGPPGEAPLEAAPPATRPSVPSKRQARIRLHAGVYAYSASYLEHYRTAPPSPRELELSHEMLRFDPIASSIPLRAHEADFNSQAVDLPSDLPAAEALLKAFFGPERR